MLIKLAKAKGNAQFSDTYFHSEVEGEVEATSSYLFRYLALKMIKNNI